MIRNRSFQKRRVSFPILRAGGFVGLPLAFSLLLLFSVVSIARGDQSLEREQSWKVRDLDQMSELLRGSLGQFGVVPSLGQEASETFRRQVESEGRDPLDAFVDAVAGLTEAVDRLRDSAEKDPLAPAGRIDPSAADYAELESLPKPKVSMRRRSRPCRNCEVANRTFNERLMR